MSRFRILKELKKSLKRKRRPVWSLGAGVAFFLLAALTGIWFAQQVVSHYQQQAVPLAEPVSGWMDEPSSILGVSPREKTIRALRENFSHVELVLHRTYLCGEEMRQLGTLSSEEAAELLVRHREWEARLNSDGRLTLEESVDDLSPECRKTAYMGMDKDGNLSLFDGPPWHEKVIRTFFQLDVEMLESRLEENRIKILTEGIRVSDKDEYNSVLSTYNEFASIRSQASPQP